MLYGHNEVESGESARIIYESEIVVSGSPIIIIIRRSLSARLPETTISDSYSTYLIGFLDLKERLVSSDFYY